MGENTNENRDEKDIEAAEGEEAETTSTEGEEEAADDAEGEEDIDTEEEGEEEGEDDEDEEEDADGEGEGEGEFVIPEKFKGKDAKAIAKSYTELEKSIEKKAQERAAEIVAKNGGVAKKATEAEKDALKEKLKGVDFSKMKPEEFAEFMLNMVDERAREIARTTYESSETTRTRVQSDIASAAKSWPQLKEKGGFRDTVLELIENAANRGEILSIKEACITVGKRFNIKPGAKKAEGAADEGDGKGTVVKKKKLGMERSAGAGGNENKTDEQKVIDGLMAGNAGGTKLGGLF